MEASLPAENSYSGAVVPLQSSQNAVPCRRFFTGFTTGFYYKIFSYVWQCYRVVKQSAPDDFRGPVLAGRSFSANTASICLWKQSFFGVCKEPGAVS